MTKDHTPLMLRILMLWQAMLAALALGAALWVLLAAPWAGLAKTGVGAVLISAGGLSALAAVDIRRVVHRGRVMAILLNYLGLLAAVIGVLQVTGVFLGLDALAGTFGRGLLWLILAFGMLFASGLGESLGLRPALTHRIAQATKWLALAFAAVFLIRVGLVQGLGWLVQQVIQPLPLVLIILAILCGAALGLMYRPAVSQALGTRVLSDEAISGFLFLSPNLLGFLIFFAGPLIFSLYISFTDSDALGRRNFIGVENYVNILTLDIAPLEGPDQPANQVLDITRLSELSRFNLFGKSYILGATDKLFWISLGNTIKFVLMAVPLSVTLALVLANLLNSKLPGMKVYRAMYFLPSVAAVVGIALIWQLLYNAAIGYINYGITSSVNLVNAVFGTALADPAIRWLSDVNTALLSLAIMVVWQTVGFNTVLFLAGLTNIPGVLYEAATVDGAGKLAQFWNVTLPMLAPTTFFVISTTTIQALQLFDQVFILMNPPEGPSNATLTMVLYLYRSGFQNFKQGYGSAIAWVLFALIFGITLFQFMRQRSSQLEY